MTIFTMSFTASLLILAAVIIRAIFMHKIPKKTFYVLWGIILCRLLIPITIPFRFSVYTLLDQLGSTLADAQPAKTIQTLHITSGITTAAAVNESPALTISPFLILWIAGMIIVALVFIITHLRCRARYSMSLPIANSFIAKWQDAHQLKRPVQIRQSDLIQAPLTYGIIKPVILLPKTLDYSDIRLMQYILLHEFTHIRHFDTLTKWLLAAALCVHWFNPLVWVMYILANRDLELICDETVVNTFGNSKKSAYALALINMEEKKSSWLSITSSFSKHSIEERITAIMKIKKTTLVVQGLALALIACTAFVFATSAAPAASAQETTIANSTIIAAPTFQTPDHKYQDYGITYDKDRNMLLNGELIRYFEDSVKLDDNSSVTYYTHLNPKGVIDAYTTRQSTKNSNGSTDLKGTLTGIKKRSQKEFDALDIATLQDQQQPSAVSEAAENDTSYSTQNTSGVSTAADSEEGFPLSPKERKELYSIYEPFGVSYDKEKDELYYQGKLVKQLWDVMSTNGEEPAGGYFSGTVRTVGNENGTISLKTIRDYTKPDTDGYGKLLGIEIDTENN